MQRTRRQLDPARLIFGLAVLLVGGYYALGNTIELEISDFDWEGLWPLLAIALGLLVIGEATSPARGR